MCLEINKLGLCAWEYAEVAGCCEHGNEPSHKIRRVGRGGIFQDWLRNSWFLKGKSCRVMWVCWLFSCPFATAIKYEQVWGVRKIILSWYDACLHHTPDGRTVEWRLASLPSCVARCGVHRLFIVTAGYDFGLRRDRGQGDHHGRNFGGWGLGLRGNNKEVKVHPCKGTEVL